MKKILFIILIGFLGLETYAITITFNTIGAACGFSSGTITTAVSGGLPPYNYLWNTSDITPHLQNLVPGVYTVIVTDTNGDTASASTTVNSTPGVVGAQMYFTTPAVVVPGIASFPCKDQCNGVAYLRVDWMNGAAPFSIATVPPLNIGVISPDIPTISGLCSNTIFTAIVTDAYGCTGTLTPTPNYVPNDFSVIPTVFPACNGTNSGQITLDFPNNSINTVYALSFSGPSSLTTTGIANSIVLDTLLPGIYDFLVWEEYAVAPCDTAFSITVPDMGTNCGTLNGSVFLDSISNCAFDTGEPLVPSRMIRITPGPYYSATDNSGNFTKTVPFGTYDLETVDNSNFNSSCFISGITLSSGTPTVNGLALGDSTGMDLDMSVSLSASAPVPGFAYTLYVQLSNLNYMTVTAPQVILDFDAVLNFNTANVPHTVTGPTQVTLDFPAMPGFQTTNAIVEFMVPAQPSLIGQLLINNATLVANQPEVNPANNQFPLQQIIIGSFDPNDKGVWPASDPMNIYLIDIDSVFQYTIRFQNTGTAPATTVVLIDPLSPYLDVETIEVLGSSHSYTWQINPPNILEVTYNNIMLPDSNTNEPGSHGVFSFEISPTPALSNVLMPYILENYAAIYFDFNPPVITNTIFNTIDYSVGLQESFADEILLHPNPATDQLFISTTMKQPVNCVMILDVSGRVVWEQNGTWSQLIVPIATIQDGLYLVRIHTSNSIYHRSFVKM